MPGAHRIAAKNVLRWNPNGWSVRRRANCQQIRAAINALTRVLSVPSNLSVYERAKLKAVVFQSLTRAALQGFEGCASIMRLTHHESMNDTHHNKE